jgi:hypothetical protein
MRSFDDGVESTGGGPAGHPSDADLLRLLDGEPPLSAMHDVTSHIRACATCSARADLLRDRRRRLGALLAATDAALPAPPTADELLARLEQRRSRSPRARYTVRAAAAILMVGGVLAAQPAVRRWAGARWRAFSGASAADVARPARVPATTPIAGGAGTTLAFEPGAGPFIVRFDHRPAAGTLTVVGDEGSRATAERVSGQNLDLLIVPDGIRIRDAGGAAASYLLHVPRAVKRVIVRFDDARGTEIVVDVARGDRQVIGFAPGRQ